MKDDMEKEQAIRWAIAAAALLVALAVVGCDKECEFECVDGFSDTVDRECDDVLTMPFVASHGGFCEGEDQYKLPF